MKGKPPKAPKGTKKKKAKADDAAQAPLSLEEPVPAEEDDDVEAPDTE